jgi:hypothetical protein
VELQVKAVINKDMLTPEDFGVTDQPELSSKSTTKP